MTEAKGWLERFLRTQMDGLTGHIEEAGYPFDRVDWSREFHSDNKLPEWWVYEQTAYWLDGYTRCAIALNDENLIRRASDLIYAVIDHPAPDGYLGPEILRNGPAARWPFVVFFRACIALYEHNGDTHIIEAIQRHYLETKLDYTYFRDCINSEIMLYCYRVTGDERILDKALEVMREYNTHEGRFFQINDRLIKRNRRIRVHGVTFNEYAKLGALIYEADGDRDQLEISIKAMKILNRLYLLPGGVNCSDEYTESRDYRECIETCDVSDYTWSLENILRVTGDPRWGDYIERAVFNAGIGAVLENFRGLQYFSCANQIILDSHSTHCDFAKGRKWMSYRPNPGTECCAGNVNRFMPNYVLSMYRARGMNIYVDLLGPSLFKTQVNGHEVTIEQKTRYPFDDRIMFEVKTDIPLNIFIRIPGYGGFAETRYGIHKMEGKPGKYRHVGIDEDTTIAIDLHPEIEVVPTLRGGAYVRRGALVYSHGEYGDRHVDTQEERSSPEFPAYNIYPEKPWGYAVRSNYLNATYKPGKGDYPTWDGDLPSIQIDALKLKGASFDHARSIVTSVTDMEGKKHREVVTGDFNFTPDLLSRNLPVERNERITLRPYGVCKVRETVFQDRDSGYYLTVKSEK